MNTPRVQLTPARLALAKEKAIKRGPEVVGTTPPEFYGPQNETKLPRPKALAAAMHRAAAGISAASTLRHVDYSK
jgi:hypothetical protein